MDRREQVASGRVVLRFLAGPPRPRTIIGQVLRVGGQPSVPFAHSFRRGMSAQTTPAALHSHASVVAKGARSDLG